MSRMVEEDVTGYIGMSAEKHHERLADVWSKEEKLLLRKGEFVLVKSDYSL